MLLAISELTCGVTESYSSSRWRIGRDVPALCTPRTSSCRRGASFCFAMIPAPRGATLDSTVTTIPTLSLQEFVRQRVREHWEAKREAILLARLGQAAIAAGISLREELGERKLADFLRRELAGEVEVEPCPNSPKHLQVRPSGQSPSVAQGVDGGGADQLGARLHRALWLAFSRPIPPGYLRRLQVEPFVRFWDLQPPLAEVAGRLPIGHDYIAPSADQLAPRLRDDVILENIRRWMRDNALDISKFESRWTSVHASKPGITTQNPLMQLIAALDEGELKRVTLPLDVIAKLLNK